MDQSSDCAHALGLAFLVEKEQHMYHLLKVAAHHIRTCGSLQSRLTATC